MATTLQMGTLHKKAQHPKNRGGSQKGQATERTDVSITATLEDFRFPVYLKKGSKCTHKWQQKEREFFNSLSHVEKHYGFKTIKASFCPYPQNVKIALEMVARHLRSRDTTTGIAILSTAECPAFLAVHRALDSIYDYYHFPLKPLRQLINSGKYQAEANLLLSICAYIYKVLGIDLYSDEGTFLHYEMSMLKEGYEQDGGDSEDDWAKEIEDAFKQGALFRDEFLKPTALSGFAARVASYKPKDDTGRKLREIATSVLKLYQQFPNRSIAESMKPGYELDSDMDPDEDSEDMPFDAYRRFSFIWQEEGSLYDSLWLYITEESGQCSSYHQPFSYQYFQKPQAKIDMSLSFEVKVFQLFEGVYDLLTNKKWKI